MLNKFIFKIFIVPNFKQLNDIVINYIDYDIVKFNELNNMFFCNNIIQLYNTKFVFNLLFLKNNNIILNFYFCGYSEVDFFQDYICQLKSESNKKTILFDSKVNYFFETSKISFKDILLLNKKIKYLSNYIETYIENDKDIILNYFDFKC